MSKTEKITMDEPGEHAEETITVDAEDLTPPMDDPLLGAPTVEREYTKGNSAPGNYQDIKEPEIETPDFESSDTDDFFGEENESGYSEEKNSDKTSSFSSSKTSDDEDDEYQFKLNGESAIYILEFLHGLFKEQYKITPELFEKYGLTRDAFQFRLSTPEGLITVGQLAEQINAMMDEVGISPEDKKALKKVIVTLSKKHDVKMTPEVQFAVILGKIGLTTHLQLKALQNSIMEKLENVSMEYKAHNAPSAPDPGNVSEQMSEEQVEQTEDVNEQDFVRKKKRKYVKSGKYSKKNSKLDNFQEPGE